MDSRTLEQLQTEVNRYLVTGAADTYVNLALPAVRMDRTESDDARSYFGGLPFLESADQWPIWDSRPLSLVCMLDLEELAAVERLDFLPEDGVLNFFADTRSDALWGDEPADAGRCRVIYVRTGSQIEVPDGVDALPRMSAALRSIVTVPCPEEEVASAIWSEDPEAMFQLVRRLRALGFISFEHQIGGWPALLQSALQPKCELASLGLSLREWRTDAGRQARRSASRWRLLAQFVTDVRAGLRWGDEGGLYFEIATGAGKAEFDSFDQWGIVESG